jgi:hypothetical protein
MRILLCAEITCGSTRKTVNLHVELVSDDTCQTSGQRRPHPFNNQLRRLAS